MAPAVVKPKLPTIPKIRNTSSLFLSKGKNYYLDKFTLKYFISTYFSASIYSRQQEKDVISRIKYGDNNPKVETGLKPVSTTNANFHSPLYLLIPLHRRLLPHPSIA